MNFRKYHIFLILLCIVTLVVSCASTKKTNVTKQTSDPSIVENKNIKSKTKPSIVRPYIDSTLAADNLLQINNYIDKLNMWTYVERVIAPFESMDQVINQDSINIFHRVIASYNNIKQPSNADANNLNSIIEFLLQKKTDVNLLNDEGEDALSAYLEIGSISSRTLDAYERNQKHNPAEELEPIVKLFIENGADIKLQNKNGVSTFDKIVDFARIDFIKPLIENNIEINNALITAIKYNHVELIDYLLEKDAILNTSTEKGKDAFRIAASNIDDFELFKKIVNKTSDINVNVITKERYSRNLLSQMLAVGENRKYQSQKNYINKIVFLLDKGIKIDEYNWDKQGKEHSLIVLALNSFSYEKSEIICKKLIEKGANVNLSYHNCSPLFKILERNFYNNIETLFELLIAEDADVNFVKNEQTALDLVAKYSDSKKEIIKNKSLKFSEILESKGANKFTELEK